jgi:hypothetical protein
MPGARGYFDVKWFKRYAIGCLIALLVFAANDGYFHPGETPRAGTIVVAAVAWPIIASIVVGSTIGEIAGDHAGHRSSQHDGV